MYHSLIIDDKNTYDDFGLIPTSRPIINPPSPSFSYIEVPGKSGVIDLSESLTGRVTYSNRKGSIEFLVPREKNWSEMYSTLMSFLHGRFMRIVLEDDPLYYYEGRLSINSWNSNKNNSIITIDYDLSPFKYETTNAVDGYIVSNRNLQGNAYYYANENTKVLEMLIDVETIANPGIRAVIGDVTYACKQGENILPILQTDGEGSIRIVGSGTITVKYRRGRL